MLRYFLAVAQEGSIRRAAETLHISQPPLSRQLMELEAELGKQLFTRGSRGITLTPYGQILYQRGEEIINLLEKAKEEIENCDETLGGTVYIGVAQTYGMHTIAKAINALRMKHKQIHVQVSDGDNYDIFEKLRNGVLDFGLVIEPVNISDLHHLSLPESDQWGVVMRKDSPLAQKSSICPQDLWDRPLIVSRQFSDNDTLNRWIQKDLLALDIVASYSLLFNASIMVEENIGYALCLNRIIPCDDQSQLCFRPLSPQMRVGQLLVWKKGRAHSQAAQAFLHILQEGLSSGSTGKA